MPVQQINFDQFVINIMLHSDSSVPNFEVGKQGTGCIGSIRYIGGICRGSAIAASDVSAGAAAYAAAAAAAAVVVASAAAAAAASEKTLYHWITS